MRSVELFSGCGGLALGLSRSGFAHDLLVEWDRDAVSTVELNRDSGVRHVEQWPIVQADVRTIDWKRFEGQIDLVAGGPPCQPFSVGGKHRGHQDDRDMWPQAIRSIREIWPQAFLFENVRGLARPAFATYLQWIQTALRYPQIEQRQNESHTEHLRRIRSAASLPTYDLYFIRVNAADFGAPQKRHRLLFVGFRRDLAIVPVMPIATHSRSRLLWDKWVSGDYWSRHGRRQPKNPRLDRADTASVDRLKRLGIAPASLPWVTVYDSISDLGPPNGSNNHVHQPGARIYTGHTGSPLDEPAKALKAGDHGVPGGENMLVHENGRVRYFTIREAARLQGLPDDYAFGCSWSEAMRQLGNAVPAQLAESFGRWLKRTIETAVEERNRAA